MLIMSRHAGESLIVGNQIEVRVEQIGMNFARFVQRDLISAAEIQFELRKDDVRALHRDIRLHLLLLSKAAGPFGWDSRLHQRLLYTERKSTNARAAKDYFTGCCVVIRRMVWECLSNAIEYANEYYEPPDYEPPDYDPGDYA